MTILEIEHSILVTGGRQEDVIRFLKKDGYTIEEIELVLGNAKRNNKILEEKENLLLTFC